ncbi:tetratricopeptide repeat protein [Undibacterium sp. TJN19]|uniref:tetratricopeptide repeat protein n=1 Tax=Undibacterium sp. TJN19 TaxID=3413055 RepID=UPI003BF100CE
MIKNRLPLFALLIFLLITFLVYQPGLSGYFFFDDYVNIIDNKNLRINDLSWASIKMAAFSGSAGMLGRPISMLSFGIDYLAAEYSPGQYKLSNVLIHLINGLCVFGLSRLLFRAHRERHSVSLATTQADWASAIIAAIWLLHPLNISSVLYVVQRMNSICALFTILGMISYVSGRLSLEKNQSRGWIGVIASFVIFTPLAMLSKENGALLPLYLLLIECIFWRFVSATPVTTTLLKTVFILTVALPIFVISTYTALHPEWLGNTYKIREFNLSERLMTEARVVWLYLRLLFVPDNTVLGLFHDDIAISRSMLNPITTLPATIGIAVLSLIGLLSVKRYPIVGFGVLFFLIGHSLESSFIPLELAHEHRNYLPIFGIIFALIFYLFVPGKQNESGKIRSQLAVLIIVMLAGVTWLRATQWGDAVEMKQKEVEHHPESIRANLDIAAYYAALPATNPFDAEDFYSSAYKYYVKASSLAPSETIGLIGLIRLHSAKNIPIEKEWVMALESRLKKYPLSANASNAIVALSKCNVSQKCKDLDTDMEKIFLAALSDRKANIPGKVQLLFAWADFLHQTKHDDVAALNAANEAVSYNKNDLDAQMNLAIMLINFKQIDKAKMQILKIRELDTLKRYTEQLDQLEKLMSPQ